nr:redoxin domain-containing protein [Methanoculleus sp. FWC-SCC1]
MPAPDFCLQDTDEQTVCLADLRGAYAVVSFYCYGGVLQPERFGPRHQPGLDRQPPALRRKA